MHACVNACEPQRDSKATRSGFCAAVIANRAPATWLRTPDGGRPIRLTRSLSIRSLTSTLFQGRKFTLAFKPSLIDCQTPYHSEAPLPSLASGRLLSSGLRTTLLSIQPSLSVKGETWLRLQDFDRRVRCARMSCWLP